MDRSTEPQNTHVLQEGENNIDSGFFHPQFEDINRQHFVEFLLIEIKHR